MSVLELGEKELARIIRSYPGDFALYRVEDGALRTLYASSGLPGYSGMESDEYSELVRDDARAIILKADLPHVAEGVRRATEEGLQELDDTYRVLHRTRGFVWVHARTRVIGSQNGCPVLLTVLLNASYESEEFTTLLDHLNGKVYVVDLGSYELLYANDFALQTWDRGLFCGRACYEYVAGRQTPCPWCAIPEIQNGCVHLDEVYSPAADRWYTIDGREMSWFGRRAFAFYSLDITELKRQQQSLEIDKMDLEKIIGNVPVGVGVCQVKSGVYTQIAMNRYLCELLGEPQQSFCAADRALLDRVHPDDRTGCVAFMHSLCQTEARFENSFRYRRAGEDGYRFLRAEARTLRQGESVMAFACLTDISAEKEAEAAMFQSRQIYESAVETARLSVWEYDIRAHRILLSDNHSTRSDREKFDIPQVIENVPESVLAWIDERDADTVRACYRRIEEGAGSAECEYWYRPRAGEEPRYEHIAYTTVFDDSGKPLVAYGIGQNITAQKLEEEKYNRLYRQLVEANPQSIGTFRQNLTKNWCGDGQSPWPTVLAQQDSHTVDGYFAAAAERVTDPAIRAEFLRLFDRERLLEAFREGQTQFSLAYPVLYNTGEPHWVMGYLTMLQNPSSGDIESVTYALDITERKKDEDIIRCVTDEKCDYIGLIDTETETFEFRNINREIAGLPLRRRISYASSVRYDLEHFIAPEDRDLFAQRTALPFLQGKLRREEEYAFTYSQLEGERKLRKQLQYSYLDRPGRDILVVQTDVTAAYEQEQQQLRRMREALRAAQEANRAKSEFLSRISHDIRTPMNVISGMTEFAFEDMDDRDRLCEDLQKIRNANTFLMSLINDILDISKIDSGKIELHPEPYPYGEYMATIRDMFEPLCRAKGLHFELRETRHDGTILADRTRLNQIMLNLISNAVKYTPPGGAVTCSAESVGRPDGRLDCTLTVSDTGVGMSAEFQKVMFEPFTQETLETCGLLCEKGTGLGLSIVKRLADFMGGSIEVKSAPGQGTEISVRFCFPAAAEEETAPAPDPAQSGGETLPLHGQVLLAEDHPINTEIALRLLESFGLTAAAAENGAKAVELFKRSRPGEYRAVLMDIQMPVMNGYDAARAIRALDRPDAQTVPIVAMTADAYAEDVQRALDAGMNAHVAKPLDPKLLRGTLTRLLSGPET